MPLEGEASSATGKSKSGGHKARARACQACYDTQSSKGSPDIRRRDCGKDAEFDRVSLDGSVWTWKVGSARPGERGSDNPNVFMTAPEGHERDRLRGISRLQDGAQHDPGVQRTIDRPSQYIQPQYTHLLGHVELVIGDNDKAAAVPFLLVRNHLGPYLVFVSSTVRLARR